MSDFETQRALILHTEFRTSADAIRARAVRKMDAYQTIADTVTGRTVSIPVPDGQRPRQKTLKISERTVRALYKKWEKDPRIDTILRHFAKPGTKVPADLTAEIHRLITRPTGGRNKHGLTEATHAWDVLWKKWNADEPIPGLGKDLQGNYSSTPATRQQWYAATYPDQSTPDWSNPHLHVPFPFAKSTIARIAREAGKELRTLGNRGKAAARVHGYSLRMKYHDLRRSEFYTADDVRLDLIIVDPRTNKPVKCTAYIMMEAASRAIASWIVMPRDDLNAIHVKQLLSTGLRRWGIGRDYPTHVLLERGTLAMTDAQKIAIESQVERHGYDLKIHRTAMNEGVTWTGSFKDKGSGNAMGKGMIESFNRQLHKRLLHLDGQIGNHSGNMAASIGFTGSEKSAPGTFARSAELLHTFNSGFNAALKEDQRCTLNLGHALTLPELLHEFRAVIHDHNHNTDHNYRGHGKTTLTQTQPGVYSPQ